MKFITLRELQNPACPIRKELAAEQDMVVTAGGLPIAILTLAYPEAVVDDIIALRRIRAHHALDRIQAAAKAKGLDKMTMKDIDALIAKVRRERRAREKRSQ